MCPPKQMAGSATGTWPFRPLAITFTTTAFLLFATIIASMANQPSKVVGHSVQARAIPAYLFGAGTKAVLIIGGIHGNEPSTVRFIGHFEHWVSRHRMQPPDCTLIIVPDANPDGYANGTRKNAHHVDLNRNFPAHDWGTRPRRKGDYPGPRPGSEPETRFILALMARFHPRLIVSVHAPYHEINLDGPAMRFARDMRRVDHDRIVRNVGYPTPGSLGTYAGKDKLIPVITLELARRTRSAIWKANRLALLAAVKDACRQPGPFGS